MKQAREEKQTGKIKIGKVPIRESIFLLVLFLYPLRHISWGLDLWDTGYNYANFQYMGTEHMDSMWLFSTYLSNVAGHFLTKLPFAETLRGMNLYTGLFVSMLALAGYWFCTRRLKIPGLAAFLGEWAAISLCWSPTALLYNYMTYLFFLGGVILLYLGLTKEKSGYLFVAGCMLGANVLVRFSNLPEAALILAVWVYDLLVCREKTAVSQRHYKQAKQTTPKDGEAASQQKRPTAYTKCLQHTLWCLGGYLTALLVLLGYIGLRYGLDSYVEGIGNLFAMTDNASDYKPQSMIMGIVGTYVENMYWVVRIVFFAAATTGLGTIVVTGYRMANGKSEKEPSAAFGKGKHLICIGWQCLCILSALVMLLWLYYRDFCSLEFYSYGSMLRPGILFLMLTMLIALLRIFHKNSSREEKLISGILFLVILLTSIGSNNGVYPSLNNLFVAAPYTLWQSYRFFGTTAMYRKGKIGIPTFGIKCVLGAFLVLFMVQITAFGAEFVFVEATGAQNVTTAVENNHVLQGMKMSPERAKWMTELSAYVQDNQLSGEEVILYGSLPALSYYLQMPSAFNPWSDLDSYAIGRMERDLQKVEENIAAALTESPVIIIEKDYWHYGKGGTEALRAAGTGEKKIAKIEQDAKWLLLQNFMEKHHYEETFRNEKFVVYQAP